MKPSIDWKDAEYLEALKAQYEEREAFKKRYAADVELNKRLEALA